MKTAKDAFNQLLIDYSDLISTAGSLPWRPVLFAPCRPDGSLQRVLGQAAIRVRPQNLASDNRRVREFQGKPGLGLDRNVQYVSGFH